MRSRFRASLLALAGLALLASRAGADATTKLDVRARVALAAVRAGDAAATSRARGLAIDPSGALDVFVRGAVSRAELEAAGAVVRTALPGLFTASIPADVVERVAALPGVDVIEGAARVHPELDQSVPAIGVAALRGPGPAFTGINGAGVIIGDVDTGVDFGHDDFENPNGTTRVLRIWDQEGTGGPPPLGYDVGVEWTAAQIDAGQCTEIDPDGHGTHVMGIAGGDGSGTGNGVAAYTYAGVAPKADLVMVKTDYSTAGVVDGAHYVFDLASAAGKNAVVNISLGGDDGPRDGTSSWESALTALTGPGRIIVKSAGNARGSGHHAEVHANGVNGVATLLITGSYNAAGLEIDGYYESTENLSVTVTTPNNTVIGPITRGSRNAVYPGASTGANGVLFLENGIDRTAGGAYRVYMEISVGGGQNMNGTWTFTFLPVQTGAELGEVDLWSAYPSSGIGAVWQTGVQDDELITEPGNGVGVITAGAWITKTQWTDCHNSLASYGGNQTLGALAPFSSPGPTRDGRLKPDITAPGMGIASTTDFDIAPFCNAGVSYYQNDALMHRLDQGTSMAAPHVTGAVALLLQKLGPLTPDQVKAYFATNARTEVGMGVLPNPDWGYGKLFIDRTTPAQLALFQAASVPAGVELRWRLSDPARFVTVALERAESKSGPWSVIDAELHAEGEVTVALDRTAAAGRSYTYRLEARDAAGEVVTLGPIEVTVGERLERIALGPVRPNPSSDRIRVDFTLPFSTDVRLGVYDLSGREVAVLAQGPHPAGRYQAAWTGNWGTSPAPPGLYFLRLHTPRQSRTERFALTP